MSLRLIIDGEWDASDFADFFAALDDLYSHLALTLEYESLRPGVYAFGLRRPPIGARYSLQVKRIAYGSPGFTDIAGLASAMREIRELFQFLITHWSGREDRKIERQRASLEVANMRLEVLARIADLEREYGPEVPLGAERYFGLKRKDLPEVDALIEAVTSGRLKGVEDEAEESR